MTLAAAVDELRPQFLGTWLLPDHPEYDIVRRVQNGLIDRRPGAIARCRGTADIADALALARAEGLPVAVRGGGHNVAGRCVVDRGVMIDLSLMRGVHVNPKARIALAEGGATWREFNRETQRVGLVATGGVVSSTGVAGLTLGGGFGWLMPKYGMALDHLRAVTMVLADGRIIRASDTEHPDLFWAVRGGGGNFGIAASLEFNLHEVGPMVTGGMVVHPFPRGQEVARFFRDLGASAPDEVFLVMAMATAPDGSGHKVVAIGAVHCGAPNEGAAYLRALKEFGPPIVDAMGPLPYEAANMMLDDSFPRGARNYWKSHFLPALTDDAIDVILEQAGNAPTPLCQVVVEHFHGGVARVPVDHTAYALRDSGYNVLILGMWLDAADDERTVEWVRSGYAALAPFVGARRYVNYLDADDMTDKALLAAYGPNLSRLRRIKRTYDPENVFCNNLNITPD
jgi:FAD/FMN-containing dehydrogenase